MRASLLKAITLSSVKTALAMSQNALKLNQKNVIASIAKERMIEVFTEKIIPARDMERKNNACNSDVIALNIDSTQKSKLRPVQIE
jgi:hypothetical protein